MHTCNAADISRELTVALQRYVDRRTEITPKLRAGGDVGAGALVELIEENGNFLIALAGLVGDTLDRISASDS